MRVVEKKAETPKKVRLSAVLGTVGLVAFPLAGAALITRLLEPLGFVALSMVALGVFGAATLNLHGDDDFLTRN